ncbi:hypothetical protein OG738_03465 [Amycolatopsis sp. NBC_01488]|nr:restriction endonuclease fold toxin [Amycolatopsis sp. NBC_01488]
MSRELSSPTILKGGRSTRSVTYVAQSKPAGFQLGSQFRKQAKETFVFAKQSGRIPYFHFDGPPAAQVLAKLAEYGQRYGVEPVIDIGPLG